jgi:hypothetical protein
LGSIDRALLDCTRNISFERRKDSPHILELLCSYAGLLWKHFWMRVTETDVRTVSRPIFKVKYVKCLQKFVHTSIVLNLFVIPRLLHLIYIHFEQIPSCKLISLCSSREKCCPISYFAVDPHVPSGHSKCVVHSKQKRIVTLHLSGASPPRHATCRYLFPLSATCFMVGAILVLNSPVKVDKPLYCRTLLPTFKTYYFEKHSDSVSWVCVIVSECCNVWL